MTRPWPGQAPDTRGAESPDGRRTQLRGAWRWYGQAQDWDLGLRDLALGRVALGRVALGRVDGADGADGADANTL